MTLTRNDYEPDVAFYRQEIVSRFPADQMKFPTPDFVAEVLSPSTEATDHPLKKRDYAAHGIGEYWTGDPEAQAIEQLVLQGEDYQCRGLWKGDEPVESAAVAGFCIPTRAVFEGSANLAELAVLAA